MEIVVPLAGPDFELACGKTKAEILVDGQPLLVRALTSRSWWRRGDVSAENFVFVLRKTERSQAFARERLDDWFPGCRTVFLSAPTQGAAFSVLAGVALCDPDQVLCVDLADIFYQDEFCPRAAFAGDRTLGGAIPVFPSNWPMYSYVDMDETGHVNRTAEKVVISNHASAGTYFFRSSAEYCLSINHAVRNRSSQTYKNLFFVCPLLNGVIASGANVRAFNVSEVVDVKALAEPHASGSG